MALTDAERQRRYREQRKIGAKLIRYRKPADRRSRPQRWADACTTLLDVLDDYQAWRDGMPDQLRDSATAMLLDDLLPLRDLVEQLESAELPRGFGRD